MKFKSPLVRSFKKIPEDLYVKRLRSLVIGEGMLQEGNIYLMDLAIKKMPKNGCIFEIGSYGGLSTNLMLYFLQKHNRSESLINCDPWIYEGYTDALGEKSDTIDGRGDITRDEYSNYMKKSFMESVKFLNKNKLPHSFQFTSDQFFKLYEEKTEQEDVFGKRIKLGTQISFAYIDGNHAYEYVKSDFENVDKHLLKSGLVLFDDSLDGSPFGSTKFMNEMKRNSNYKLLEKNPNYLFEKVV